MSIKSFSPEMTGRVNRKSTSLEEKILNSKDAIPHSDVKKYADYIIGRLKMFKDFEEDSQERETFVVDALNEGRIIKEVFHGAVGGNISKDDIQMVVGRIRRALVEELKGKVDEKIYFVVKDFVNFQEVETSTVTGARLPNLPEEKKRSTPKSLHKKNIISHAVDVGSGGDIVYKNQERLIDEGHEKALQEAMDIFVKLKSHPNIIKILENDPKNERIIYEHRKIKTLPEYILESKPDFYNNPQKFINVLQALNNCMEGADYLAENGLVLQDVKPSNVGVEIEDDVVRGVLFDLEGLIKKGTLESSRMYAEDYRPPETMEDSVAIMPDEMTYQFGVSLKKILKNCVSAFMPDPGKFDISEMLLKQGILKDLKTLSESMSETNPHDRISLPSAITELESIIERIKNIAS